MTKTAYDFQLRRLDGAPLPLAVYAGRPLLIVNTASECGFTPHYIGLQALWDAYKAKDLVVIGVPSNDFGRQEPGTADEIAAFCARNFQITFPMAEKAQVTGPGAVPLFKWLATEAGALGRPRWNFTKYLIDRDGRLANWFFCFTSPDSTRVKRAIERAIAR